MESIATKKPTQDSTTRDPARGSRPRDPVEPLRAFLAERERTRTFAPGEFAKFERRLLEVTQEVARSAIAEELAAADESADAIEVEGRTLRRVLRSTQSYMTAAGTVAVERWLYKDRSDVGSRAVAPMDLRSGIVGGFWTPEAAKQGAWVVAQMTPAKAEELFRRVGSMQPSKSSLDRLPKQISSDWEENRTSREARLRETLVIPENTVTLAVSIDGVLAPMEGTEPVAKRALAKAQGRTSQGPVGYREIGCATLSFCDDKGDMIAAVRLARAPETKKRTLKGQVLAEVLAILERRPELKVVKVADAVQDNWDFLGTLVPEGAEAIDFFHASEHLHAAIAAAYGDGTRETRYRFEENRDRLRDETGGVTAIIRAIAYLARKHPKDQTIRRALGYFRNNKARMNYAELRAAGLPIGSGVVEAACKTLVTQRLKLSGMRWSGSGAQAILTLRGWDLSDRFDEAWALVAAHYHVVVHTLANVFPFRRASE